MYKYNCFIEGSFVGQVWAGSLEDAWEIATKKWGEGVTDVEEAIK